MWWFWVKLVNLLPRREEFYSSGIFECDVVGHSSHRRMYWAGVCVYVCLAYHIVTSIDFLIGSLICFFSSLAVSAFDDLFLPYTHREWHMWVHRFFSVAIYSIRHLSNRYARCCLRTSHTQHSKRFHSANALTEFSSWFIHFFLGPASSLSTSPITWRRIDELATHFYPDSTFSKIKSNLHSKIKSNLHSTVGEM